MELAAPFCKSNYTICTIYYFLWAIIPQFELRKQLLRW